MLVLLGEQYTEGSYVGIIMIIRTVYRGFLCWYYYSEQYTEGSYVGIIR